MVDQISVEDHSIRDWESDRLFRAAFDHASIGMAITSTEGVLLITNQSFAAMLGYSRAELAGSHVVDITHPDDREQSRQLIAGLLAGEADSALWEKRYLHKAGRTVWARLSAVPVTDQNGDILYFVAQMEDITDRREAEAALKTSEERFRMTFESAASGMALVNPRDGRFLLVNEAGREMLGYSEEEILTIGIGDVTAPEDRERSMTRFRKVVSGEAPSSRARLHYLRADGSKAHAIVSTALVKDPWGESLYLVANVVDISEQIAAQEKLQSLLDSKDQLIASVSHELRTPLTAVHGFAELLRNEPASLSEAEQISMIEDIADQTADLAMIVEDLLVAARVDNETLTVVHVPVDLRAQFAQVIETLSHSDAPHGIEVIGGSVRGLGDPARVRQILRNIVTNAERYGGERLEVKTYAGDQKAFIAVADNGMGIPEDERDLVFEPYHRAQDREGMTASIGLGLTVSRKLARLMGGDLTYQYEDGQSIFELSLPLAPGHSDTA